ncbi:methyl-accepting chemotaxis protein [Cohnella sp. 56]|uniref:methyl-accepting chemotaxis protein n=1 Tax=Cohnella sp. 56 TaxID=3113722 RepID=UPI0030EA369C
MRSIRAKLFIAFVACIVAAVAVVGYASYTISAAVVKRQAVQAAATAAGQAGDKLDLQLQFYEQIAKQIAVDPDISANLALVNAGADAAARLRAYETIAAKLNSYLFAGQGIGGIYLLPVDQGLKAISTASFTFKEQDREAEWFRQFADSSASSAWLPTAPAGMLGVSGSPVFTHLRKIDAATAGGHATVLLVELKTKLLDDALAVLKTGGAGRVLLADAANRIFADTEPESDRIGASLAADSQRGWLVAAGSVPVAGWQLASLTRWSALTAQVQHILNLTLVIIAICGAAAVAVAYGMARSIGRPIAVLSQLMRAGQTGDFSGRATLRRKDELGQLAAGYNAMADHLDTLVGRIRQASDRMAAQALALNAYAQQAEAAAGQVAAATGEIATGAANLAAEAEKGMASAQHIEARVQESDQACRSLEQSAEQVLRASHEGAAHLRLLGDKATEAERTVALLLALAGRFADSAGAIGRVLELLEDISKQTEILSFNAAIEAVRSQEDAGRGFKVIADEVRQLSARSKQSIEDVRRITGLVQNDAHDTTALLREAQPLFSEQVRTTRSALAIFGDVAGQMDRFRARLDGMADGNRRLGEAQRALVGSVGEVGATSEQAAAASEQVAALGADQLASSARLVELAAELREVSANLQHSLAGLVTRN